MAGSSALVPVADDGGDRLPALPPGAIASARRFADASRAASTRAKYTAVWEMFAAWCLAHGHAALPAHPAVVAGYLAAEAAHGGSPSWVQLQLAAIGWVHRRAGHQPPQRTEHGAIIAEILAGIRRARAPARAQGRGRRRRGPRCVAPHQGRRPASRPRPGALGVRDGLMHAARRAGRAPARRHRARS
jgi:hypothetical protein